MGKRERGESAERIAASYLEQEGYEILDRNVSYRVGELDIVARQGSQLVFVEVRSRWGKGGPRPEDTVTYPKRLKLTRAATLYLAQRRHRNVSARFDVVGVSVHRGAVLAHYVNAFEAVRL